MIFAHSHAGLSSTGSLGDEQRLFSFESEFARDLRCIPMVVRFKLDRCCIKLSLRQWSRMGAANRGKLLIARCDHDTEIDAYGQTVVRLATAHCIEPIRWLPADAAPAWADTTCVPADVIRQAADSGIAPPSPDAWRELSVLERFALLKLARSDHDNLNFVPAMREMQLIAA